MKARLAIFKALLMLQLAAVLSGPWQTALAQNTAQTDALSSARITLLSETRSIYLGDSVVLDIESSGLRDPLDVDVLKSMPEFLRETVGTRIAVFGGKVVEINIRRMEFIPGQTGVLFLGPLFGETTAGRITSNTIDIDIQPALTSEWQPSISDTKSRIRFSNTTPIVGEQIVVDITLQHTHQIANESITLPSFADFDVIPIIEQRRTIEGGGDAQWRQIAWRYLLHPKRSGELDIGSLQWRGTMIKSRSQRGAFEHETEKTVLSVTPTPADRPEWWLPASSVKLSDEWSKDVRQLSAGDEIIRTITLTAQHVLGSQLPDIAPLPTRALTSTLIRTTRDHQLQGDHTLATATYEYRMVAQSPIPVFLDTVRVPWWDVNAAEHKEAILPARRINVGLPDRADLLADLAVEGSTWARLVLNLRSFAAWQSLMIATLALAVFALLLPLMLDGWRLFRLENRHRHALERLEYLRQSGNWTDLYAALSNTHKVDSDGITLDSSSHEYQALMQALQTQLFSPGNDVHNTPPIDKKLSRQLFSYTELLSNKNRSSIASL